jgi:type I site-specific restriction-modification system R (restriction) subunit
MPDKHGAKLKIRKSASGSAEVFDVFRKKYVKFNPEEKVRQDFLHFLINEKHFPASLISVEKGLTVNGLQKRFDAVAYNNNGCPLMLMEFKSSSVKIKQSVFEQISVYNIILKVNYLVVSNGITNYCCRVNYKDKKIEFLNDIPDYGEIKS